MCLAVPAKIISLEGNTAQVDVQGVITSADVTLIDNPQVGDYVMVHTGFAIQKYDEQEALENLALLAEAARRVSGLE